MAHAALQEARPNVAQAIANRSTSPGSPGPNPGRRALIALGVCVGLWIVLAILQAVGLIDARIVALLNLGAIGFAVVSTLRSVGRSAQPATATWLWRGEIAFLILLGAYAMNSEVFVVGITALAAAWGYAAWRVFRRITRGTENASAHTAATPTSPVAWVKEPVSGEPQTTQQLDQPARRNSSHEAAPSDQTTPMLDLFGQDLTAQAAAGQLAPVFGRDEEIKKLTEVQSLSRKNNAIVIGEAGVGKTSVVEGFAQQIADGQVPRSLAEYRIVAVDLARLLGEAQSPGQVGTFLSVLFEEAATGKIIVFLDEIHQLMGSSAQGAAADALKPALSSGTRVIGATTLAEYRQIEEDGAFKRRFTAVRVEEPSLPLAEQMLRRIADDPGNRGMANLHDLAIPDETIAATVKLADRYVPDGALPDKAIDLLDLAAVRRANELHGSEEKRVLLPKDIVSCLESQPNTPPISLDDDDRARLQDLESKLAERVLGQPEAVATVAAVVQRAFTGFADNTKPRGSFFFAGPTGVGKTELVKAMAETVFGDPSALIRFDMSEFSDKHTTGGLISAPPGYVGHGTPGRLTEAVRQRPFSIVLFDETEKAHPDVLNVLLQMLDDGRLTDFTTGKTVDFTHTYVVLTSNIGAEHAGDPERVRDAIRAELRPELINRLDEVVVFDFLPRDVVDGVVEAELKRIIGKAAAVGGANVTLAYTPELVSWLAEKGYSREYGARNTRREVTKRVTNHLSDATLRGVFKNVDSALIDVDLDNDEMVIRAADSNAV